MPDPTGTHSDGSVIWGSQILTLPTGGSVTYIAEAISTDLDSKIIETMNEAGVPNAQVFIEQVKTGTATLQLSGPTVPEPTIGAKFALVGLNSVSANFRVKKVGVAYQQDGETKVNIEFRKSFT